MARSDNSARAALNGDSRPVDAALDALAEVLAPRVARLLRADASTDDDRDARLNKRLARYGYELDKGEGAQ